MIKGFKEILNERSASDVINKIDNMHRTAVKVGKSNDKDKNTLNKELAKQRNDLLKMMQVGRDRLDKIGTKEINMIDDMVKLSVEMGKRLAKDKNAKLSDIIKKSADLKKKILPAFRKV